MNERHNIKHPMWRKKVDKTLLQDAATPIPNWVKQMWDIENQFQGVSSKRDSLSKVSINFDRKNYEGNVCTSKNGRTRLFFEPNLAVSLREVFLTSFMQCLDSQLSNNEDSEQTWEFLDIEYDIKNRKFKFVAHYTARAEFPNLYRALIGSPTYKQNRKKDHIAKTDWIDKDQLAANISATNVIYTLVDTQKKHIYIGEADNLYNRLSSGHTSMPTWDKFRYSVLPEALAPYRLEIERMAIRDAASVFRNTKVRDSLELSEYTLKNTKIDH